MRKVEDGYRRFTKSGYIQIKKGNRFMFEHRFIMELVLNRKLTSKDIVHHIDGDKADNRPENLVVTTRPKHAKQHYIEDPAKQAQFKSIAHLGRLAPHKGRTGYKGFQETRPEASKEGLIWNHHKQRKSWIVRKCYDCLILFWSRKDWKWVGVHRCRPCSCKRANQIQKSNLWLKKSKNRLPLTLDMVRKAKEQMLASQPKPIIIDGEEYYFVPQKI